MRDYKQVNEERYERDDYTGEGIINNIYSTINPIGFYDYLSRMKLIRRYIKIVMRGGRKLDEIKILDCGCGAGTTTRMVAEIIGNSKNVFGFEYSRNRLKHCQDMNGNICYEWGDIVSCIPYNQYKFDGVMTFDVLSQIRKKEDVISGLKNIYDSLEVGGVFLWFDLNEKTHYSNYEDDSHGFSVAEMDQYCSSVGFSLLVADGLYKRLPFSNKTTYYMHNEKNSFFLSLLDFIMPTKYMINARIYIK